MLSALSYYLCCQSSDESGGASVFTVCGHPVSFHHDTIAACPASQPAQPAQGPFLLRGRAYSRFHAAVMQHADPEMEMVWWLQAVAIHQSTLKQVYLGSVCTHVGVEAQPAPILLPAPEAWAAMIYPQYSVAFLCLFPKQTF